MAKKTCKVCKRSYPSDLKECPHCAKAIEVLEVSEVADDDIVELDDAPTYTGSGDVARKTDSAIDLGDMDKAGHAPSGTAPAAAGAAAAAGDSSLVWASLIEGDEASGKHAPAGAPAAHPAAKEPTSAVEAVEFVEAAEEAPPKAPSSPDINLGQQTPAASHLASDLRLVNEALEPGTSGVNLGEHQGGSSDRLVAELADDAEPSGVHLGAAPPAVEASEAVEALADESSGVDLAAAAEHEGSSDQLVAEELEAVAESSGVDLANADLAETAAVPRPAPTADAGLFEEASAVNLGEKPAGGSSDRGSGRDLIAEAVESGVDLDQPLAAEPHLAGPGVLDSLEAVEEAEPDDSAVDLGAPIPRESSASAVGKKGSQASSDIDLNKLGEVGVDSGTAAASLLDANESSGIDLGPTEASSKVGRDSGVKAPAAEGEEELAEAEAEEEAAAFVDDEEAAAAADEDEEKPAKPSKPRYGRRWVAGGVMGALVGSATCVGLWLAGIEPPASWRQVTPVAKDKDKDKGSPAAEKPTLETAVSQARSGDFDKALPMLEGDGDEPERLLARGEARWLTYLRQQRAKNAPPKADDDEVKKAVTDLQKANNADALLWLGQIEEATGNYAKAKETYEKGGKTFPAQQRLFNAALDRLETGMPAKPEGAALLGVPAPNVAQAVEQQALVMLLIGLQPAPEPMPAPQEKEAAEYFFNAVKLAQRGEYDKAIEALKTARATHDQRRFTQLRKPQNPKTDPLEEVFLRSCDELLISWQAREKLLTAGYLEAAKRQDPAKALDGMLKDLDGAKTAAKTLMTTADTLTKEKKAAEAQVTTLQNDLKKAKDDAAAIAKALEDKLKASETKVKVAEDKLKEVGTRLVAAGVQEADQSKGVDALAVLRDAATATIGEVAKKLADAKYMPDKSPKAALLKGVDDVIRVALMKDPNGYILAREGEIKQLQGVLEQRWTPFQMLAIWQSVLSDRNRKDAPDKAALDVQRVTNDAKAPPEARSEALYVQGLILRNQGKYAEARMTLQQALAGGDNADGNWQATARKALAELSDPAVFYLPRAEALRTGGQYDEAVVLLTEGLQVQFPKDSGKLLALRSLVHLDKARAETKGRPAASNPGVASAKNDAKEAVKAGAGADGHYAEGRVAEELGQYADAEQHYRKALDAHPDADPAGSRYRVALARVILQPKTAAPREGKAGDARTGRLPAPADSERRLAEARTLLTALLLLLPPADGEPGGAFADLKKARELCEQAIAAGDPEGYLILARVNAREGEWTKGLTNYVEGLKRLIRSDYADGLAWLVENHPMFKLPDLLQPPDPLIAEQHYAQGLRLYQGRRYREAEEEFSEAVHYNGQDARYRYYLGLSELPQDGKANLARENFRLGAKEEAQNRPSPAAVGTALERIQGDDRRELNRYRFLRTDQR